MNEQKCQINGIEIKFKKKNRKYDTKHLIVVFSGFGGTGEFTYDFEGALQDCPADILWIKDDFFEHCTYYLCKGMNFSVEFAVHDFIKKNLEELNLTKEQCTVAGFSKGGSAALYFGTKYNIKNILSTVPQFYVGSYARKNWPVVANHMMGEDSEINVKAIDHLITDVIKEDKILDKNIYLLTSCADKQYMPEIAPNLSSLIKYKNFNLLLSTSILVREHNQVTVHHLPLILGILYSLAQGAAPRYGYTELGGDAYSIPKKPSAIPLTVLKSVKIENGKFYPEGVAILRELSCAENKDIIIRLHLVNDEISKEIHLAKGHKPYLTRFLYNGNFVNYDKGWFCSPSHAGFILDDIAVGKYQLYIVITCQGVTKKSNLTIDAQLNNKSLAEGCNTHIFSKDGKVFLHKD